MVGTPGCPMAHCDPQMSDTVRLSVPISGTSLGMPGTDHGGSFIGLGCSSDGQMTFACSFARMPRLRERKDNVVIYDRQGQPVWSSGDRLGALAAGSAPVIATDGTVYATDDERLIRVSPNRKDVEELVYPTAALPISPVPVGNGHLLIASKKTSKTAPLMLVDATEMKIIASVVLSNPSRRGSQLETFNTPAVSLDGKRAYVSTYEVDASGNETGEGFLVALDLDVAAKIASKRIRTAWLFPFKSPTGASPTVLKGSIYFDAKFGDLAGLDTYAVAVKDEGSKGTLLWKQLMKGEVGASFAVDPRGGVWAFALGQPELLRLDAATGNILQTISVDSFRPSDFTGAKLCPSSAVTVYGNAAKPVLVFGAAEDKLLDELGGLATGSTSFSGGFGTIAKLSKTKSSTYVMAIDVTTTGGKRVFAHKISDSPKTLAAGQFPGVVSAAGAHILFTTLGSGPYLLGTKGP